MKPDEEDEFTAIAALFAWKCSELQNNPIIQTAYLAATLANLKDNGGLHPAVDCAVSIYGKVIPFENVKSR